MRLLFVDDEPRVLTGVENALLFAQADWEADFAPSGEQAIELMARHEYDVLVTDMKMPGVDGADVLSHAMENHPGIVRLALSGEVDPELAARGIPLCHEFVSKPCEPDELFRIIERVYGTAHTFETDEMPRILAAIDRLPSSPNLHLEVRAAIDREEGVDVIARLIETDLAIASSMVRTANSAFYGFRTPTDSVRDAVVRLGTQTVSGVVLNAELASWVSTRNQPVVAALNARSAWMGGIVRKLVGKQHRQAPLAGLLRDVGVLALLTQYPNGHQLLDAITAGDGSPDEATERAAFGVTHAEIGAFMLEMWNTDPVVTEVVRYHHTCGSDARSEESRDIIAAIAAADAATTSPMDHPAWLDPALVARAKAIIAENDAGATAP